jgi:hypothetical protein
VEGTLRNSAALRFAIIALALLFHITITSSRTAFARSSLFCLQRLMLLPLLSLCVHLWLASHASSRNAQASPVPSSSPQSMQSASFFSGARTLEMVLLEILIVVVEFKTHAMLFFLEPIISVYGESHADFISL